MQRFCTKLRSIPLHPNRNLSFISVPHRSYKDRFRPLNDGTIRRWKEGKRHNAHLKSKKSKRRLRQPGLVPPAYAKVMKKLNFCN